MVKAVFSAIVQSGDWYLVLCVEVSSATITVFIWSSLFFFYFVAKAGPYLDRTISDSPNSVATIIPEVLFGLTFSHISHSNIIIHLLKLSHALNSHEQKRSSPFSFSLHYRTQHLFNLFFSFLLDETLEASSKSYCDA